MQHRTRDGVTQGKVPHWVAGSSPVKSQMLASITRVTFVQINSSLRGKWRQRQIGPCWAISPDPAASLRSSSREGGGGGEAALNHGDLPGALLPAESFHISSPLRHVLLQFVTFRKSRRDLKSIGGFKVVFLGRCSRTTVKSKALDSHSRLCGLPPGRPQANRTPSVGLSCLLCKLKRLITVPTC